MSGLLFETKVVFCIRSIFSVVVAKRLLPFLMHTLIGAVIIEQPNGICPVSCLSRWRGQFPSYPGCSPKNQPDRLYNTISIGRVWNAETSRRDFPCFLAVKSLTYCNNHSIKVNQTLYFAYRPMSGNDECFVCCPVCIDLNHRNHAIYISVGEIIKMGIPAISLKCS